MNEKQRILEAYEDVVSEKLDEGEAMDMLTTIMADLKTLIKLGREEFKMKKGWAKIDKEMEKLNAMFAQQKKKNK